MKYTGIETSNSFRMYSSTIADSYCNYKWISVK